MIAHLIDEELACRARGKNYKRGTLSEHLEKQISQIIEAADQRKKEVNARKSKHIDKLVYDYIHKLARATNYTSWIMLQHAKEVRPKTYEAEIKRNSRRYERLDELIDELWVEAGIAIE